MPHPSSRLRRSLARLKPLATNTTPVTFTPRTVFGVDYSGAKHAGKTAWLAEVDVTSRPKLVALDPLGRLAGDDGRDAVNVWLVERIAGGDDALWAMDFPFGLPVEIAPDGWRSQLAEVTAWPDGAGAFGHECVRRCRAAVGTMHVRRDTDREAKAPFDCFHYRIIYQTFHGMRDVLAPLADVPRTAVYPFQPRKLPAARRVLVEACPSSVLKRWGLPHQNYKQPAGGPVAVRRLRNRQTILRDLSARVDFTTHRRRVMLRNPGGDALDAVLAAVGGWTAWRALDHAAIRRHPRYPREGLIVS